MFGYVSADLTEAPSTKDSVTRSATRDAVMVSPSLVLLVSPASVGSASFSAAGVARHQAGGESPGDADAGPRVGHQSVGGPGADTHALGLQVPGGAVQVDDLPGDRVVGVVGGGRRPVGAGGRALVGHRDLEDRVAEKHVAGVGAYDLVAAGVDDGAAERVYQGVQRPFRIVGEQRVVGGPLDAHRAVSY